MIAAFKLAMARVDDSLRLVVNCPRSERLSLILFNAMVSLTSRQLVQCHEAAYWQPKLSFSLDGFHFQGGLWIVRLATAVWFLSTWKYRNGF